MTQTVARPRAAAHKALKRQYEDIAARVRQEELAAEAMRRDIDDGPGDEADHATARAQLDELAIRVHALRAQLHHLSEAMSRLESGGYGSCERCQRPIPAERLAVFPAATHCVACKSALERR